MSQIILPVAPENAKELAKRRRHVTLTFIANSQLPYRVEKKTTGVWLASFETPEQVSEFLLGCCPEQLAKKPTSRTRSRR